MSNSVKPISVSELTKRIKLLLEGSVGRIYVEGEISNWRPASSGHCYFALKDDKALIKAVMFRGELLKLSFKPKEGMKVEIAGMISVYESRGEYQIIVYSMKEAGVGDLYKKFIELKEKLAQEGLFDPKRKKQIPFLPKKIGVITSPTGAAIRDILNILNRRFSKMEVIIFPVKVQGDGAAKEIAHAIKKMNDWNLAEVLIVGRGGGSIEDLWAFNEEAVAWAIYNSAIPIISAVGHEIDFTIADFVADMRAPTPSAAAELVVSKSEDLVNSLNDFDKRLTFLLKNKLVYLKTHLEKLVNSWAFRKPLDVFRNMQQKLDDCVSSLDKEMLNKIERARNKFLNLDSNLRTLNPESILNRGYSIVYKKNNNAIIKRPDQVKSGDEIKIQNAGGFFDAVAADSMPLFDNPDK